MRRAKCEVDVEYCHQEWHKASWGGRANTKSCYTQNCIGVTYNTNRYLISSLSMAETLSVVVEKNVVQKPMSCSGRVEKGKQVNRS